VKKVTNLYLYYLTYKQSEIEMLCEAIHQNPKFQDLRIYASKFDISWLAKHLYENESIWLISLSFNHLKAKDADYIIDILKKLKNLKEFCAHHNKLEDEGCNKIATYISENMLSKMDYVDLSHNQTVENKYFKILQEHGYKGVTK